MDNRERVLLGFSGGVDSAAAAVLLEQSGYQVVPVVLDMGGSGRDFLLARARKMASCLGLKLQVESVADIFAGNVVEYLLSSYSHALTPNPCVRCNALVKFAGLAALADRLQIEKIATGHYFRRNREGCFKAYDRLKDQSYFLFSVAPELLQRSLFPLGEIDKKTALTLAEKAGYELADYRESQELCFLNGEKYQEFMRRQGVGGGGGEIVDLEGQILGQHSGLQNYTIGQRRGLGIAYPVPLYVVRLDYLNNRLLVGERDRACSAMCEVAEINWLAEVPESGSEITCQIRYRHSPAPAKLNILSKDRVTVEFAAPQFAITPGQGAAFFRGNQLLGGGFICSEES